MHPGTLKARFHPNQLANYGTVADSSKKMEPLFVGEREREARDAAKGPQYLRLKSLLCPCLTCVWPSHLLMSLCSPHKVSFATVSLTSSLLRGTATSWAPTALCLTAPLLCPTLATSSKSPSASLERWR